MSIEGVEALTVNESQAKKLMELAAKREPLNSELEPWVEDTDAFGPMLRHPLVYMILGNPVDGIYPFGAQANASFEAKQKGLAEARAEKHWGAVLNVFYERPYRLYAFEQICEDMTDEEYWDHLGDIWTDSENIWQNEIQWIEFLTCERPRSELMMDWDELAALEAMPDTLRIYRGFHMEGREQGCSWTVERARAEWFARRYTRDDDVARVATGTAAKTDVLAHFMGRGEHEIVILPEHVNITNIEKVEAPNDRS